jgi:thiol-disulfide isomerase/thioredoxin
LSTVVLAFVYAVGLSVPLVAVAQGSRRIATAFRAHAQTVRIAAGVVMAAVAVVLYTGPVWLTDLQTHVPGYVNALQRLERTKPARKRLARLNGHNGTRAFATAPTGAAGQLRAASAPVKVSLTDYGRAPDFHGVSRWFNTPGLSLDALRGKVVLIDFWTYSCINCLRTLPHLEAWNRRYAAKGLMIVGVHTPEFEFEHDAGNVRQAVRQLGVRYPVAMDNDYATWNAYSNQYWPAEYLIDQSGHVRHIHFGEGEYDQTEKDIRLLLRAGGQSSLPAIGSERDATPTGDLTPESYLGYRRADHYWGSTLHANRDASYRYPPVLGRDQFAYAGRWKVEPDRILSGDGAKLRSRFHARSVHLVLGGHGTVRVSVDGKQQRPVHVAENRLYTLYSTSALREHVLNLSFTRGLAAYAFTFG